MQQRMKMMATKKAKEVKSAKPTSKDQITITKVKESIPKSSTQSHAEESEGVETTPQVIAAIPPELVGAFVEIPFNLIAEKRGNHWKLKETEKKTLGELAANWLNTVLPDLIKQQPELFALVLGVGMIVAPKLREDAKIKRRTKPDLQGIDHTVQAPEAGMVSSSASS